MVRERWGSRLLFIFAAVGSAAGLGNLWRFPYLAYKYGGGAFLIPYLIILFVVGVPLLLLEFSVGQRFQRGAVESMYRVNRSFSGVGLMGVIAGFIITGYYAVVMSWAVIFLVKSFSVAWAGKEVTYFYRDILNLTGGIGEIASIQWPILIGLIVVWLGIYFSIWQSAKSASKVIMITMPLPVILVICLAVRGMTLGPGSFVGMNAYLIPNLSSLLDVEVWTAAISQIFFTLTLGFGTMIAYGSYNDESQELVKSTYWTVFLNSSISLIAGFAVFGTIGFMSYNMVANQGVPQAMVSQYEAQHPTGVALEKKESYSLQELRDAGVNISGDQAARHYLDEQKLSGPGLAFVVYPKAIAMFSPGWLAAVFGVLFFVTLLSLGIDSAFSLVEAITTAIADELQRRAGEVNHSVVALVVCVGCFLQGLLYTTGAGLYFLDLVDHYVNNYNLVVVGLLQAIAVGWFFDIRGHRDYINSTTNLRLGRWWEVSIRYIIPLSLIYLIANQLIIDLKTPYGGYPPLAQLLGWSVIGVPLFVSLFVSVYVRLSASRDLEKTRSWGDAAGTK